FSGMDNLFTMNACYARSDEDLQGSIEEIIEFSGLEDFIHRPVREYSTGMKMRLGIAYILYQDFDLLLIDEVLAVGDLSFQRRCLAFLKTKIENGASVLICSHNLEEVAQLCSETILLDKGKTLFQGKTEEVIEYYLQECEKRGQYISAFEIGRIRPSWQGSEQLDIKNIRILDHNQEETEHICVGDSIDIEVNLQVNFGLVKNPLIRVLIHRNDGLLVFGVNNYRLVQHFDIDEGEASFRFHLENINLQASLYYLSVSVWPDEYCSMVTEESFDEHYMKYKLYVNTQRKDGTGIAYIPCAFNVIE
ncbi:Wzt carbohydrate-binding domain-containing protein, partial [bacterium]|nr:Wzt carbohydrate-binding domain-containing protein [bacterium]